MPGKKSQCQRHERWKNHLGGLSRGGEGQDAKDGWEALVRKEKLWFLGPMSQWMLCTFLYSAVSEECSDLILQGWTLCQCRSVLHWYYHKCPVGSHFPSLSEISGAGGGASIQRHPQPGNPINHRTLRDPGRVPGTPGKLLFQPLPSVWQLRRKSPECQSHSLPCYFPGSG